MVSVIIVNCTLCVFLSICLLVLCVDELCVICVDDVTILSWRVIVLLLQ